MSVRSRLLAAAVALLVVAALSSVVAAEDEDQSRRAEEQVDATAAPIDASAGDEQPLVGYFGPPWLPGKAEVRGPWVPGAESEGYGLLPTLAPDPFAWLAEHGLDFFGWYMIALQGNVRGGLEQEFDYAGLFDFGMNLDFGKLIGLHGLVFHASGSLATGTNLTDAVGAAIPVNAVYSGDSMRLFELYLEAFFLDDTLSVRAGRLTTGWEYGLDYDMFTQYLGAAFRLNVFSLDANDPNFSVIPFANWGARVRWTPSANWRVQASAMNGYPRDFSDDDKHGVDFSADPSKGMFFILEGTYQWLATEEQRRAKRGMLPGRVTVGGYYDTGEFPEVSGSGQSGKVLGSAYAIVRQKVWEPQRLSERGINMWTAFAIAGKEELLTFPMYWSGGLVWEGPFQGRDADTLAFGFAVADFSSDLPDLSREIVTEWDYTFHLSGWLDVTPSIQYIIRPGGSGDIPSAVVLGALCYVTL